MLDLFLLSVVFVSLCDRLVSLCSPFLSLCGRSHVALVIFGFFVVTLCLMAVVLSLFVVSLCLFIVV